MTDEHDLTKEEIERRAGELARRVMSTPPKPRAKQKPEPTPAAPERVAKPRKRGQVGEAS
jgi:hypothetical protein